MPSVGRASAVWAFIAAFGASYLVVGLVFALLQLALGPLRELEMLITGRTIYISGLPEALVFSVSLALGAAAASYVAKRAGGDAALVGYGLVVAAEGALVTFAAIDEMRRAETGFTIVSVSNVPLASAAVFVLPLLAIVLAARGVRSRSTLLRPNALLEAAGSYAIIGSTALILIPWLGPWSRRVAAILEAPFLTVHLDATPHFVLAAAQIVIAALVYASRRGRPTLRAAGVFALIGLAGVASFDIVPIWNTLFLDWTYVPLSSFIVPSATAALGMAVVGGVRRFSAPHPV